MSNPILHFIPGNIDDSSDVLEAMCGDPTESFADRTFSPRLVTCAHCKDAMLESIHNDQGWEREMMHGRDWALLPLFIEQQVPAAND